MIMGILHRLFKRKGPLVDWGAACGRHYLTVAGYVVAMAGDPCRDSSLLDSFPESYGIKNNGRWTEEMIKHVVERAAKEE